MRACQGSSFTNLRVHYTRNLVGPCEPKWRDHHTLADHIAVVILCCDSYVRVPFDLSYFLTSMSITPSDLLLHPWKSASVIASHPWKLLGFRLNVAMALWQRVAKPRLE